MGRGQKNKGDEVHSPKKYEAVGGTGASEQMNILQAGCSGSWSKAWH